MKQVKQPHSGSSGGRDEPESATIRDSRPSKPPAKYPGIHRFPVRGRILGPTKQIGVKEAVQVPSGEGAGRPAKPEAPIEDAETAASRVVREQQHPDSGRPGQQPRDGDGAAGRPGEQYVRLRVRVRGDRLTVIDSHLVDGPLAQPDALHGASAYEVMIGDRLVHTAAIPDLGGMQRSFPNPDGPPDQRGHHLAEREVSEFSARIPAGELTRDSLDSVRVRLHRLVEPVHGARIGARSLGAQMGDRVEQIAEVRGLPDSVLPEEIERRGGRTGQGGQTRQTG